MKSRRSIHAFGTSGLARPAAAQRRTTPTPQSMRYAVVSTRITVAGPNLSGSALGLPVPSMNTRVRDATDADACAPSGLAARARGRAKATQSANRDMWKLPAREYGQ